MPGPVSDGCGKRNLLGLEQRLTQPSFEVLASEAPGKWFLKSGVASAECVKGFRQLLEAGVVIRLEHLALVWRGTAARMASSCSGSAMRAPRPWSPWRRASG
jgi:hypothetical protein